MVFQIRRGRVDPARTTPGMVTPAPDIPLAVEEQQLLEMGQAVRRLQSDDATKSEAAYQELVGRGLVTAFERTNFLQMAQQITPPVQVVTFAVPGEFLFRLDAAGFMYSDPMAFQLDTQTYLPWQVTVEGRPIPGLGENNSVSYRVSPGDIWNPFSFEPVWCKSNQTIVVEIRTLAAVTTQVNVAARISGGLIRKTSLRSGRLV